MTTIVEITTLLQGLSESNLDQVRAFVESLRRKEPGEAPAVWSFDFLSHFEEATLTTSRNPGGVEYKVGDATCAGVTYPALWEHPPVSGSASIAFLVPIPNAACDLKLKFALGVRDGAQLPSDRMIAFRVLVNGWKLWSAVKNSHGWEAHEIKMPQLDSDVVRIEFVTDGLGDNRWNWAVWGVPRLESEAE